MKKILILMVLTFILSGCGKYNAKNLISDLNRKVEKADAYHLSGTLEIYRNDEKFSYSVDSAYKKDDNFKVSLINQNNNHEQIILRNSEGIYVLTPSLNKSFKFQSDWPYNNSQIYLLQPILSDLNNDTNRTFETTKDGYIITSNVEYATEKDFKKQKVYVDNDKNITKVEVLDENDNVKMSLTIIDIDYDAKYEDDYFDSNKYYQEQTEESKEETTGKLEEIVYPMYVPTDTYLTAQDIVNTGSGQRAILTFAGESSFTVVQENLKNGGELNYVNGDPYLILDTVGLITDYSVSWISNGVEYSVMSDTMPLDELLTVAQSISVKAIEK